MALKISEKIEKMQDFLEVLQVVASSIGHIIISSLFVGAFIWLFKGLFRWILKSISYLIGLASKYAPATILALSLFVTLFLTKDFMIEKGVPKLLWTTLAFSSYFGCILGLFLDSRSFKKKPKNEKVRWAEPELGPPD